MIGCLAAIQSLLFGAAIPKQPRIEKIILFGKNFQKITKVTYNLIVNGFLISCEKFSNNDVRCRKYKFINNELGGTSAVPMEDLNADWFNILEGKYEQQEKQKVLDEQVPGGYMILSPKGIWIQKNQTIKIIKK